VLWLFFAAGCAGSRNTIQEQDAGRQDGSLGFPDSGSDSGGGQGDTGTDSDPLADSSSSGADTSAGDSTAGPGVAFDFLKHAPSAYWHTNSGQIAWGTNDASGSATKISTALEDNTSATVLFTHPKWIDHGFTHGAFNVNIPPASKNPYLLATFGFRKGADLSDGVTFSITTNINNQWVTIFSHAKKYSGALETINKSLTNVAGKTLTLYVNADAGATAHYDWAIWKTLEIIQN
jgi:hypothetical protein